MIKKEFREILVPTLLRISVLSFFPLLSLPGITEFVSRYNYYEFLSLTLGLVTLWIASTYGIDAFKSEHRDQAMEYLFSFPLSKSKIVLYKLIPRVSVLLVLAAANILVNFTGYSERFEGEGVLFYLVVFLSPMGAAMFFLLAGFFTSPFFEKKKPRIMINLLAYSALTAVSLGVHALLLKWGYVRHLLDFSFFTGSVLVLAAMGAAFVSVYGKMDLKPGLFHGKRFIYRTLPPLVALTVAGLWLFITFGT